MRITREPGYLIFPTKGEDRFLDWQTLGPSCALFIVSIAAVALNQGGIYRYCATAVLGATLLYYARRAGSHPLESRGAPIVKGVNSLPAPTVFDSGAGKDLNLHDREARPGLRFDT